MNQVNAKNYLNPKTTKNHFTLKVTNPQAYIRAEFSTSITISIHKYTHPSTLSVPLYIFPHLCHHTCTFFTLKYTPIHIPPKYTPINLKKRTFEVDGWRFGRNVYGWVDGWGIFYMDRGKVDQYMFLNMDKMMSVENYVVVQIFEVYVFTERWFSVVFGFKTFFSVYLI